MPGQTANDKVIVLEADDDELVERLSGRRQSEATGEVYHIEHNPPPEEGSEEAGGEEGTGAGGVVRRARAAGRDGRCNAAPAGGVPAERAASIAMIAPLLFGAQAQ